MVGETTFLYAVITAILYAIIGYLKSNEKFNPIKFFSTVILGVLIGAIMYASGIPITEENVLEQMAAYAGILYTIENIIKAIIRRVK